MMHQLGNAHAYLLSMIIFLKMVNGSGGTPHILSEGGVKHHIKSE